MCQHKCSLSLLKVSLVFFGNALCSDFMKGSEFMKLFKIGEQNLETSCVVDKIQSSSLVAVIIPVIILLTHGHSGCGYILRRFRSFIMICQRYICLWQIQFVRHMQ